MVPFNHRWVDKGIHIFPEGINLKVNVIARLEFELDNYDVIVLYISYNATEILSAT